jgi:hypothetical protein
VKGLTVEAVDILDLTSASFLRALEYVVVTSETDLQRPPSEPADEMESGPPAVDLSTLNLNTGASFRAGKLDSRVLYDEVAKAFQHAGHGSILLPSAHVLSLLGTPITSAAASQNKRARSRKVMFTPCSCPR